MSGHERERLSAYLDGELSPEEMAVVAAHVKGCGECAARLAEFGALDEAAATLAAEAPSGYFEALPSRVRARLTPAPRARQLPVWTWAAAAALLLAVIAPLTLSRHRAGETAAPSPEASAPRTSAPPAVVAQPPAQSGVPARPAAPPQPPREARGPRPQAAQAAPSNAAPAAAPSRAAPQKREHDFAREPEEADRLGPQEPHAPAAAAAPRPQLMAPAARSPVARAQDAGAPAALSQASPQQEGALREPGRSEEKATPAAAKASSAPAAVAQGPDLQGVSGATAAAVGPTAAEAEWRRLEAARPDSAAAWRERREELRRYVTAAPRGPHADAARVRTIEAGLAAFRLSGDEQDALVFRRDAAAYLEREDAQQKPRVEQLLDEARPRVP